MRSKLDELMQEWERQGKVAVLSDEETRTISERISEQMTAFRHEFAKQQAQSEDDLSKIILKVS